MNFNDFPILSNLQYEKLSKEYSKNDLNQKQIKLANLLHQCKSSLFFFTDGNSNLRTELANSAKELTNIFDIFKLLYPKITVSNSPIQTNLFSILTKLCECIELVHTINFLENNQFYSKRLSKIEIKLVYILKNISNKLSELPIRLFKHI